MALSVDRMRAIDYHVGRPLCLIVSVLLWLLQLTRVRGPAAAAPRRVLFIELSEMGSAIIADPALRRMQLNSDETFFLIFKDNAKSLSLLNTISPHQVWCIDASNLVALARDTLAFIWRCRGHGIDTVIDLELFSRYTSILTGLSGARNRVGFHNFHGEGLWRGEILTHRVAYNPHQHMSKNFMALVETALAATPERPSLKRSISDDSVKLAQATVSEHSIDNLRSRIADLLGMAGERLPSPIVLINPNASDLLPQRRWPQERFAQLVSEVTVRWPGALVLLTGAKAEFGYVQAVLEQSRSASVSAINLAGKIEFSELPALYHLADAMVTNDSGPAHFAAITPLKTVVLYGPETPVLYGSMGDTISISAGLSCSPCVSAANHRKTACTDNVCMQAISVERVLLALGQQLDRTSKNDRTRLREIL